MYGGAVRDIAYCLCRCLKLFYNKRQFPPLSLRPSGLLTLDSLEILLLKSYKYGPVNGGHVYGERWIYILIFFDDQGPWEMDARWSWWRWSWMIGLKRGKEYFVFGVEWDEDSWREVRDPSDELLTRFCYVKRKQHLNWSFQPSSMIYIMAIAMIRHGGEDLSVSLHLVRVCRMNLLLRAQPERLMMLESIKLPTQVFGHLLHILDLGGRCRSDPMRYCDNCWRISTCCWPVKNRHVSPSRVKSPSSHLVYASSPVALSRRRQSPSMETRPDMKISPDCGSFCWISI